MGKALIMRLKESEVDMISKLTRYDTINAYTTKDGSEIREMMHPKMHANKNQSVAEARVQPGGKTEPHCHEKSEEIYVVMQGRGSMRRGAEHFAIEQGVTVAIMPGQVHSVVNTGTEELVILCCCAPAYGHDDTVLKIEDI